MSRLQHVVAALALFASLPSVALPSVALADGACFPEPTAAAPSGSAEDTFARARRAFEAKRFAEAGPLFEAVALEHPEQEVGIFAAQLSLECMNLVGTDSCFQRIGASTLKYRELYCTGAGATKYEEACGVFQRITADVARHEAEQLVSRADATRGEAARRKYVAAGDAYAAIWHGSYEAGCKAQRNEACARADEVLYNAARAYQAAHDLARASAMRATLIDPKNRLDETALGRKAVYELGGSMQAVGEYAKAADHYEQFAAASPKDEHAPGALSDAIVLRLSLGERDRAEKDADLFFRNYGAKKPAESAGVALAFAAEWDRAGEPAKVERHLSTHRAAIVKAMPDQAPYVDVLLANALRAQKKTKAAHEVFDRVAKIDARRLTFPPEHDVVAIRALGRSITAIGDARLALADEDRDAAMKLVVKKGDAASYEAKSAAIAAVEKKYGRILELEPAPPPGPVVVAAGRVGRMRARFWAETHLALGASAGDVELERARAANAACVQLSVKLQRVEPEAERCGRWLERHFPDEIVKARGLPPRFLRGDDARTTIASGPRMLDEDGEEHLTGAAASP